MNIRDEGIYGGDTKDRAIIYNERASMIVGTILDHRYCNRRATARSEGDRQTNYQTNNWKRSRSKRRRRSDGEGK
jgi:hypothetical protein